MKKGESAVFTVAPKGEETPMFTVVITGGDDGSGEVTLKRILLGEYTVTETAWSWAYTPTPSDGKITQDISRYNTFTFNNSPIAGTPLHCESHVKNKFESK